MPGDGILALPGGLGMANLRTKLLDFTGFCSIRILILRSEILRPKGISPEVSSQRILVWRFLVWRLAVGTPLAPIELAPNEKQGVRSRRSLRLTQDSQLCGFSVSGCKNRSKQITRLPFADGPAACVTRR